MTEQKTTARLAKFSQQMGYTEQETMAFIAKWSQLMGKTEQEIIKWLDDDNYDGDFECYYDDCTDCKAYADELGIPICCGYYHPPKED